MPTAGSPSSRIFSWWSNVLPSMRAEPAGPSGRGMSTLLAELRVETTDPGRRGGGVGRGGGRPGAAMARADHAPTTTHYHRRRPRHRPVTPPPLPSRPPPLLLLLLYRPPSPSPSRARVSRYPAVGDVARGGGARVTAPLRLRYAPVNPSGRQQPRLSPVRQPVPPAPPRAACLWQRPARRAVAIVMGTSGAAAVSGIGFPPPFPRPAASPTGIVVAAFPDAAVNVGAIASAVGRDTGATRSAGRHGGHAQDRASPAGVRRSTTHCVPA